jgi:hypothetical protein
MRRYRAVRNTLKVIPTPWELASATVTSLWQLAEGSILWRGHPTRDLLLIGTQDCGQPGSRN